MKNEGKCTVDILSCLAIQVVSRKPNEQSVNEFRVFCDNLKMILDVKNIGKQFSR